MSTSTDFADRHFKIECNDMILTRGGSEALLLRGPGEVWQEEDGRILFKTFLGESQYQALMTHTHRIRTPGQLVADDDCFRLDLQEFSGAVWSAESVFPSMRGGLLAGVATGTIYQLSKTTELPHPASQGHVLVRFQGKLKFPCNQNTEVVKTVGDRQVASSLSIDSARIESDPYRFEVRTESEHTVFTASVPASLNLMTVASRLQEALQFVLGQELTPLVIETMSGQSNTLKLLSGRTSGAKGQIPHPLRIQHVDFGGHFWRMFVNYFRHAVTLENDGWHPISEHVGSTIESSVASLGAGVLALAVAVEGLAGSCLSGLVPVDASLHADLDRVATALTTVEMSQTTRNRIGGALVSIRRPRNSDFLRAFIANQRLPSGLYDSWSRLRHSAAHGGGTAGRDMETTLRMRSEVTMLLYSIVFHAIGYNGPRTDYSLLGWPESVWPIPSESPPTSTPASAPAHSDEEPQPPTEAQSATSTPGSEVVREQPDSVAEQSPATQSSEPQAQANELQGAALLDSVPPSESNLGNSEENSPVQ